MEARAGVAAPRLVLILTENHTLFPPGDLRGLADAAATAEAAGFDAAMVSEHVVLGPSSAEGGTPANPREYALPGNQDPSTPWPDPLTLLAAIAAITTRLRLVASSIIAPLRHPILLAKQLATLDLLSEGRLVVQPTVSWHREEYAALGVPFERRGELLDEHLEIWRELWTGRDVVHEGGPYGSFGPVTLEPRPFRPGGPILWFGGERLRAATVRRIVRYGRGFNPLGRPTEDELVRLRRALSEAGRDPDELEMVGGTRGRFPDATGLADLDEALAQIPPQLVRGFGTICIKPSQFLDDPARFEPWCRDVVRRVDALAAP